MSRPPLFWPIHHLRRRPNSPNRNQPELGIPGLIEEMKRRVNRPVPELPLSEDTDLVNVSSEVKNGNGQGTYAGAVIPAKTSLAVYQQDAPPCPKCGHLAIPNGRCHRCHNCGESLGCS